MGKKIKNSDFQFARPVITDLKFKLNDNFNPGEESQYKFGLEKTVNKNDGCQAIVELKWFTNVKAGSINPKYEISITMASSFHWNNEIDNDMAEQLLNINAVSLLISYMRPIISVITSNSVEPMDIPFVNLKE